MNVERFEDLYLTSNGSAFKFGSFGQTKYSSFVPLSGGMFIRVRTLRVSRRQPGLTHIQLKFYFDSHPEFGKMSSETLEVQLWEKFAKAGVLVIEPKSNI